MPKQLPTPTDPATMYLAALLEEIRGLREDLSPKDPWAEPLPDDLPQVKTLRDAGIQTWGELNDAGNLSDIKGIGPKTESQLIARLRERS